jgi:hypothetical protein
MISIVAAVVAIKPVNFVELLLCTDKRCHASIASGVTIMADLLIACVLFPCDSKFSIRLIYGFMLDKYSS